MSAIDFIIIAILASLGFFLVLFFLHAILSPFLGSMRGVGEKRRFKRKTELLAVSDLQIKAGKLDEARKSIWQAFYLEHVRLSPDLIDQVSHHHMDLLGRTLQLSDLLGTPLQNLPVVEELLTTRVQLMKSYIETIVTRKTMREQRRKKGKRLPPWALKEYSEKLNSLKERLSVNRSTLARELDALFRSLDNPSQNDQVTFH